MVLEKWQCPGCRETWEIDCEPPGALGQVGFCDFICPTQGCGRRLLDDPVMNDESTLPGLLGAAIRYRKADTTEWHQLA